MHFGAELVVVVEFAALCIFHAPIFQVCFRCFCIFLLLLLLLLMRQAVVILIEEFTNRQLVQMGFVVVTE